MQEILLLIGGIAACISFLVHKQRAEKIKARYEEARKERFNTGFGIGKDLATSGMSLQDIQKCFFNVDADTKEGIYKGALSREYEQIIANACKDAIRRHTAGS